MAFDDDVRDPGVPDYRGRGPRVWHRGRLRSLDVVPTWLLLQLVRFPKSPIADAIRAELAARGVDPTEDPRKWG